MRARFRCENPTCDPNAEAGDRVEREQRRANATSAGYDEEAQERGAPNVTPGKPDGSPSERGDGGDLSMEEREAMRRNGEFGEDAPHQDPGSRARNQRGGDATGQGGGDDDSGARDGEEEGSGEDDSNDDQKGAQGGGEQDGESGSGGGEGSDDDEEDQNGATEDPYEPPPPPPKDQKAGKPIRYVVGRW